MQCKGKLLVNQYLFSLLAEKLKFSLTKFHENKSWPMGYLAQCCKATSKSLPREGTCAVRTFLTDLILYPGLLSADAGIFSHEVKFTHKRITKMKELSSQHSGHTRPEPHTEAFTSERNIFSPCLSHCNFGTKPTTTNQLHNCFLNSFYVSLYFPLAQLVSSIIRIKKRCNSKMKYDIS